MNSERHRVPLGKTKVHVLVHSRLHIQIQALLVATGPICHTHLVQFRSRVDSLRLLN